MLALRIARQTAYRWKALLNEGGVDALLKKPSACGFETDRWTLKQVSVLIHRLYGAKFGLTPIWLIPGASGFSPKKPERRAIKHDEGAVRT